MITETLIICAFLFMLFHPIVGAKADEIRERARTVELDNDDRELRL